MDNIDTLAQQLVGRTEAEADALLKEAGVTALIVARDDEQYTVKTNFLLYRVHLTLRDGKVIQAARG